MPQGVSIAPANAVLIVCYPPTPPEDDVPGLPSRLLPLLLVTACASARTQGPAYTPSEVDTPPRLLGCPEYPASGPGERARAYTVDVEVTVDARGSVQAVSVPAYLPEPKRENELRVRQAALSCRYEPGLRAGAPVAVHGVRLRVSYPRVLSRSPEDP